MQLKLFDFLCLFNPALRPECCKVHLASHNQIDDPLDVYRAGEFNEWQRWQSRRNFDRDFVVSLIAMKGNKWLFAGVHSSLGAPREEPDGSLYYELHEEASCQNLNGRLVVSFERDGRQSYRRGENCAEQLLICELREEPLTIVDFPGFKAVNLSWLDLRTVVSQSLPTWRAALSSVAGIYVISDSRSRRLYVGSAYGEGGLWQRWCAYADSGHGGNVELMRLQKEEGEHRHHEFRFSILEIADTHATRDEVLQREAHWKDVLMTRGTGLNAN